VRLSVALSLAVIVAPAALAQPVDPDTRRFGIVEDRESNAQGYYFHVLPGEATKEIAVWGTVRLPGTYVVGASADLGQVLSLAGGPLLGPLPDRTQRTVIIRVYHHDGDSRALAYEAPLERMVREPAAHPPLISGDIIEVETREVRGRDYRDTLAVVSSLGTLAVVILQVVALAVR
jgi:hypothetical protein